MHVPSATTSQYHAQLHNKQKQQSQSLQEKKKHDEPEWHMTSPNLYQTSLRLCRELTTSGWWQALVDVLTDRHATYATRLTLCMPHDASETGVWGLKAQYQQHSAAKCHAHLMPLDHDAVSLVHAAYIPRLLQRQDMVILSREYRSSSCIASPKIGKPMRPVVHSKMMERKVAAAADIGSSATTDQFSDYDDYEQQQPSPWSHSPLPSPALMDPDVNPFFQSIPDIDDDAFNPESSDAPQSPQQVFPLPASNTQTIVHIPLLQDANGHAIAILSFLSPVVPFPVALQKYIRQLQPFISTSLANCLAYERVHAPTALATPHKHPLQQQIDVDTPQHSHTTTNSTSDSQRESSLSLDDSSDVELMLPLLSPSLAPPPPTTLEPSPLPHTGKAHKKTRKKKLRRHVSGRRRTSAFSDDWSSTTTSSTPIRDSMDRLRTAPKNTLLRLLIDGIAVHVFMFSATTGQVTWVNQRVLQYTGRTFQEHLGPGWTSHMHPDDQAACRQAWQQALEQGTSFAGEYRLRRFDGVYRYFLWRVVPLRDIKGSIIHWFGTCTDVHDQQLAQENHVRQREIQSNERKYRLLAEAIPQIVFTFSPKVGLTYANEKWSNFSGQPFEATAGLGFMSQVHPEDRMKLQLPDLSPEKTVGVTWHTEIRLMDVNGQYCWFLVKCISVDELAAGEVRWFGTCTDINDQKLLEHKLKEAHYAAQKSTESKTRFLSNMSHEIRTPLIGITGMLNFLLDTELTPEQLDYAHTIQQSAESLLVVINDILDLSKVEAGMMKLEWEPFCLVSMIEAANELLSTLAVQKGLELSFWVDNDVPSIVIGDRVRLRQVLLNLIGNAIKFTSKGEVFTRCVVLDKSDPKAFMVQFEVIDTGTGFNSDEQEIMFKPFSQVDSSSTRKYGGSGLGLVISQQLIELHGGVMNCSSKKGHGSVFTFTAKFEIPEAYTQPLPQTPQNEPADPFFRTDAYTVVHDSAFLISKDSNSSDGFNSSPIAHSKKHSQAADLDVTDGGYATYHQMLFGAAKEMRLRSPPVRRPSSDVGSPLSNATSAADLAASTSSLGPTPSTSSSYSGVGAAIAPEGANEANVSPSKLSPVKLSPPLPTAMSSSPPSSNASLIASTPPCSKSSPSFAGLAATSAALSPDLLSPNTTVILPPRTPTTTHPLHILNVCQWDHSRETMEQHVRTIIDNLTLTEKCYTLASVTSAGDALAILQDTTRPPFDYVLINLQSDQQIMLLTAEICRARHAAARVLVVTTPMQRSQIMDSAARHATRILPSNCGFIFKPLKRSKLHWYFGVRDKMLALGHDLSSAPEASYRSASTQKEIFRKMESDVGGRGFRILLVEDNLVNQKVLTRYLLRVGLDVEVANDGEECVQRFLEKPHGYYSLILCDLFMPVKDGYEATREIRSWEAAHLEGKPRIPIVALSANVMSNVATQCLEAGFSTYISKPVNFAILSDVIRTYILPQGFNTLQQ
ncbi:hypothetical protein BC940DRAFT_294837 [Gongronella butleri]|nr:hypothetical protein BC940DRAFT_294837 [Gongronella butleri]